MSRLYKLAINKKKLKATMMGLALSLTIGLLGGVGSYAYFTDQDEVKNSLSITLGNINTNISKDLEIKGLESNNSTTQEFFIHNDGSLDQDVNIKFRNLSHNIDYSKYMNSEKIKYKLKVTKGNKEVANIEETIRDLNKAEINIGNLKQGEKLNCELTVTAGEIYIYEDSYVKFELHVDAKQLGGGN